MKFWIATLLLFFAAAGALAQDSSRPPVARFTERDNGRVVRLPVGAELTVRLPERAGTAYRWALRDSDNIRQIGAPKVENVALPGIVGGTVFRTFRLQVVAGGRTPIRIMLRSAIPGDRYSPRRFDLTVDADTMRHIPIDYGSDDRKLISIGERDANLQAGVVRIFRCGSSATCDPGAGRRGAGPAAAMSLATPAPVAAVRLLERRAIDLGNLSTHKSGPMLQGGGERPPRALDPPCCIAPVPV